MSLHYAAFWSRLDEFEPEGVVPEWAYDQQERSRATRDRILHATSELLEERDFSEIALKDVAAAAGVSVGAVYGRFPSKEAILLLLGIIVIDGVCRRFEEALEPPRGTTGTFGALARAYVTTLVREFTRHRSLIREVRKHAGGDPSLRRLADRTNRTTHGAFLERARTFAGQIDHPDPESRLNYALFAVNAAGREAILSGALSTYAVDGSNAELIEELTRMMTAYVGIED